MDMYRPHSDYVAWLCPGSTVVEHLTRNPKIQGLNPTTGTWGIHHLDGKLLALQTKMKKVVVQFQLKNAVAYCTNVQVNGNIQAIKQNLHN